MNILPDDSAAFQQEALTSEQRGTWTEHWLNKATAKKLFHLLVPQRYGGYQMPLPELLPILEQASYLDGSLGWTLTLGSGAGVFAAYMNPDFARKQFAKPETFITGSGYQAGTAKKTSGGFKATGKWKYATGAPHATLFTAPCLLEKISKAAVRREPTKVLTFYPDEVQIKQSWNSYGLKATASHDFEVHEITVPAKRTFTIHPDHLIIDEPLYRFPFESFAICTLAASFSGMARRFLNEASEIIIERNDQAKVQTDDLIKSQDAVHTQWQRLHDEANSAWDLCRQGQDVTQKQQNKIAHAAKQLTSLSLDHAQRWYLHCGMQILEETSRINRAWRDLHTACQHKLLTPALK